MADTITSPNMNLVVPVPSQCPAPEWAQAVYACLYGNIDQHNHSPGQGVPITPSGMNISSNLSFGGNSAINLKTTTYTDQTSALASSFLGCVYIAGGNLYYNAGADGFAVQITNGHTVVGSSGTIGGLPSGTASATYSTPTFTFQSATSTPANLDGGSLFIREVTAGANAVKLSSPTSLAADYTLTFPAAPPGSTSFATVSSAGLIATSISTANGITGSNIVSGVNLPGNTVQENGRNVIVSNTNATASLAIVRGSVSSSGGTVINGEGFSVSKFTGGSFLITFTTAFTDTPIVTATLLGSSTGIVVIASPGTTTCNPLTYSLTGTQSDRDFQFSATGQRA